MVEKIGTKCMALYSIFQPVLNANDAVSILSCVAAFLNEKKLELILVERTGQSSRLKKTIQIYPNISSALTQTLIPHAL